VLLQHPVEVDELFRPRTIGARSGKVVLLGSLGLNTTGITSHVHPPRARLKAANPSSHAAMVPSLLSSSLSWVRSVSRSSTATTDIATMSEGEEVLHQSTSRDQRYDKKQAQAITGAE
jgi:hypothetical protein